MDENDPQTLTERIIRILVADKHPLVRNGVVQEVTRCEDMGVVGETADGYEALQLARQLQPDVVILDVRLTGLNGVQLTRLLSRITWKTADSTPSSPAVLVFSTYSDKQYIWSLLAVGARGYLLKSDPLQELIKGIRQVAAGQTVLSLPVQTALVEMIPKLNQELSDSEMKVLQLLAQGLTNREIAQNLAITEGTVKTHLNNTYRKVPWIRTRAEAIAWAWINRIVSD